MKLIDFIFSDKCFACDAKIPKNEALCRKCSEKVSFYNSERKCAVCNRKLIQSEEIKCGYCEKLSPHFDGAIALYPYKEEFSKTFSEMKFHKRYNKIKPASKLMAMQFEKLCVKCDFIIPVPTSFRSYVEREYCSANELSYLIGKECSLKVYDSILKKKYAKQQAKLKIEERYENINGAFSFNKRYKKVIQGKTVLLIDDVITSGATASECSKILKQNGASQVYVLAFLYGGEVRRTL